MHVYSMGPIDFGWEDCFTVEEYEARLAGPDRHQDGTLRELRTSFEQAQHLARRAGWEGDFRGSPHVFFVPGDDSFLTGFAWKQDNNGTTFVVSPIPMPHLDG